MDTKNLMPKKDDYITISKKTISLISILIILGVITGLILSSYFLVDANQKIDNWNQNVDEWSTKWDNSTNNYSSWGNSSKSGSNNSSHWSSSLWYLEKLSPSDVLLSSIGVISVSITCYLLIGLIVIYLKIFLQSRSSFISGLLLVLVPLFIISLFFINTLRSLYFASAFRYDYLGSALGFGIEGLGGIISILSFIEIIGLSILLYLTME